MAKSARASTRKRNNRALRAKVFGPAFDARTKRLSAKLQEVVDKPGPGEERNMEVDKVNKVTIGTESSTVGLPTSDVTEHMEIDGQNGKSESLQSAKGTAHRPSRTEKKIARRKAKASIVFAATPLQKQRQKQRIQGTIKKR